MYSYDNRVVITLDAGGTNLVFGAMQANKFIVEPITLPSHAEDLDRCLATMVEGFTAIIDKLDTKPVAISFAFPGPADYPNGIIGGYLPNFPSFREGVALGPFLEAKFGIPVFINNDGDLFAYGEALGGALPEVNARLEALGSPKSTGTSSDTPSARDSASASSWTTASTAATTPASKPSACGTRKCPM